MKRRALLCAAVATLAGLSGCGTNQLGGTEPLAREGAGYVVATLVSREESYDPQLKLNESAIVSADFHTTDDPRERAFSLVRATPGTLSGDDRLFMHEPNGTRVMVMRAVKPGKYRMGSMQGGYARYNKVVSMETVDAPAFDVREGEVVYVGSLQMVTLVGKNLLGMAVPATARLQMKNEFAGDVGAMKRVDPRLQQLPIRDGLGGQPR